jgi:hypothetical protein
MAGFLFSVPIQCNERFAKNSQSLHAEKMISMSDSECSKLKLIVYTYM